MPDMSNSVSLFGGKLDTCDGYSTCPTPPTPPKPSKSVTPKPSEPVSPPASETPGAPTSTPAAPGTPTASVTVSEPPPQLAQTPDHTAVPLMLLLGVLALLAGGLLYWYSRRPEGRA